MATIYCQGPSDFSSADVGPLTCSTNAPVAAPSVYHPYNLTPVITIVGVCLVFILAISVLVYRFNEGGIHKAQRTKAKLDRINEANRHAEKMAEIAVAKYAATDAMVAGFKPREVRQGES